MAKGNKEYVECGHGPTELIKTKRGKKLTCAGHCVLSPPPQEGGTDNRIFVKTEGSSRILWDVAPESLAQKGYSCPHPDCPALRQKTTT